MNTSTIFCVLALGAPTDHPTVSPVVEREERVYSFTDAGNGAGPMWCSGSTCVARVGDRLFASGLETLSGASPLNNCRCVLWERTAEGWTTIFADPSGRTREPSPIAVFADGRVLLSVNPTLGTGPEPQGGPARPDLLQFQIEGSAPVGPAVSLRPDWDGSPPFSEHSYRSLASDGSAGELILFQNIGYTHAEWTFRDRSGQWAAKGKLRWPWGSEYEEPEPIRVCYPCVAIRDGAVHFFGVSDIVEPNRAWRAFKRELTGREWDYDFRRLFYTSTDKVTSEPFAAWVEIASRDQTCGWLSPNDLWLAPGGDVHLLWSERAIDERLREKFFPEAKQRHALNHAVVRQGKVVRQGAILEANEGSPGLIGSAGRFHATADNRLFVVHLAAGTDVGGNRVFENRIVEVLPDGSYGPPVRIPFQKPLTNYFTTTVRAGSPASETLELLGTREGEPNTISYARVRLSSDKNRSD
jgi:hypothetical protein